MSKGRWHHHTLPKWQLIPPAKSKIIQRFFAACGRSGGETAARNMTREERRARAKQAVEARWARRKPLIVTQPNCLITDAEYQSLTS